MPKKSLAVYRAIEEEHWKEVYAHIEKSNSEIGDIRDRLSAYDIEFARIRECMFGIKNDVATDMLTTRAVLATVLLIFGALVLHLFKI